MKAEELMQVIGEADDDYIQSAEESRRQPRQHRTLSFVSKIVLVAAILSSLVVTAYATDFFGLRMTVSNNHDRAYFSFQDMPRAMEEAGFQMDVKEAFENGYAFDRVDVCDVSHLDEKGIEERSYAELDVRYKSPSGDRLLLSANQDIYAFSISPENVSRQIGGIDVEYHEGTYKFYPMEQAGQMTEEDEAWQKQPGNHIGYVSNGGDGTETKITSLRWVKDGVYYYLMDQDGTETEEALCAIAEELITKP